MASILVVDDDPNVRLELHALLAGVGHQILVAPNGEAALGLTDQAEPDLVITDLVMPALHGVLLIESLHAIYPDLPVIAISGKGADQLQRAKVAGAATVLGKPIQRDALVAEVNRLLRQRS